MYVEWRWCLQQLRPPEARVCVADCTLGDLRHAGMRQHAVPMLVAVYCAACCTTTLRTRAGWQLSVMLLGCVACVAAAIPVDGCVEQKLQQLNCSASWRTCWTAMLSMCMCWHGSDASQWRSKRAYAGFWLLAAATKRRVCAGLHAVCCHLPAGLGGHQMHAALAKPAVPFCCCNVTGDDASEMCLPGKPARFVNSRC